MSNQSSYIATSLAQDSELNVQYFQEHLTRRIHVRECFEHWYCPEVSCTQSNDSSSYLSQDGHVHMSVTQNFLALSNFALHPQHDAGACEILAKWLHKDASI
jgi:hypothetical protein